jgi:hypothetical protein
MLEATALAVLLYDGSPKRPRPQLVRIHNDLMNHEIER